MRRWLIFLLLSSTLAADDRIVEDLTSRIDELLLLQKARELNISVESELNWHIAEWQTRDGAADSELRGQLRDRLLIERVIGEEVQRSIVIPEGARRKYYAEHRAEFERAEEVWLRKIFVSTEGKTVEQIAAAEARAKRLVEWAPHGENFGELARDYSDDAETVRNLGEMPPYRRGELRRGIDEVVFEAGKGYVTDPLRVPEGFLILRVERRYAKGVAAYEQVEEEIAARLARPLLAEKLRAYLTRLRADAFLQIRDGYTDSGAAPRKDTRWRDVAPWKPPTTTKQAVAAERRKRLLGIF